ncbi:hypothetical protein ACFL1B_00280 [Nanoarchaeota archaeon]
MAGKILFIIMGIFLLLVSSSIAVQGPFNYQGGQYYVVTSTDASEDTGTEVCAKVGKVCVGYTEKTTAVCKLVHPNAADTSSVSGDASGIYCNGPPQTNICANKQDTCHACPACSVGVDCSTAIGNLYREMYVECGGAPMCPVQMASRNTKDLLNEVPILNSQLMACPVALPGRASMLINNGNLQVNIAMKSGSNERLTLTVANKQITGIQRGGSSCKQKIAISETNLDTILGSRNTATTILQLYSNKQIKISGCGFFRGIVTGIVNPIARIVVKRNIPPPPPAPNCGNLGEQCNNRACHSGICAAPYENVNGQWRPVNYRCIDQQQWNSFCQAMGNARAPWSCFTGPCR